MELTPENSPKLTVGELKKQNAVWRKRVKAHANSLTIDELKGYITRTEETLYRTTNIAVGLTERERLRLLNEVLAVKESKGK